jgi:membrane protein YqaA with SNARE-associated domain
MPNAQPSPPPAPGTAGATDPAAGTAPAPGAAPDPDGAPGPDGAGNGVAPKAGSAPAGAPAVPRWAIHRRMYDWVLSLADTKHSTGALFGLSFAESSFFPIPPDVLLGPLCLGNRRKSMWFATVTTVASVLGAFLGYAIGHAAIDLALLIPGITQPAIDSLAGEFEERGDIYVLVAALTPIPFKLLTITAGTATMNLMVFTIACVIGRAARFYAVAGLFWWIGPKAAPFIDKYFNWLCLLFTVLLVGGFAVISWR